MFFLPNIKNYFILLLLLLIQGCNTVPITEKEFSGHTTQELFYINKLHMYGDSYYFPR